MNHCHIDRAPNIYHQIEELAVMIPNPMPVPYPTPHIDLSFPHRWQAEVLATRPLILPPRHFVYPQAAEEVERGALEVLVRLGARPEARPDAQSDESGVQPFLATCALGFRDPAVPTGLWSTPKPEEICAVAGGYAYLIDTTTPERFVMIPYRPVLEIRPFVEENLLLFVGHHSILAWGRDGQAWESDEALGRRRDDHWRWWRNFARNRLGDDSRSRKTFCARPAERDTLASSEFRLRRHCGIQAVALPRRSAERERSPRLVA